MIELRARHRPRSHLLASGPRPFHVASPHVLRIRQKRNASLHPIHQRIRASVCPTATCDCVPTPPHSTDQGRPTHWLHGNFIYDVATMPPHPAALYRRPFAPETTVGRINVRPSYSQSARTVIDDSLPLVANSRPWHGAHTPLADGFHGPLCTTWDNGEADSRPKSNIEGPILHEMVIQRWLPGPDGIFSFCFFFWHKADSTGPGLDH